MILCERPPAIPKTTFSAENEMELKVEESLMMPAVFHTVASRTQLAVVSKFLLYSHTKGKWPFCMSEGKLDVNYEMVFSEDSKSVILVMVCSSEPLSWSSKVGIGMCWLLQHVQGFFQKHVVIQLCGCLCLQHVQSKSSLVAGPLPWCSALFSVSSACLNLKTEKLLWKCREPKLKISSVVFKSTLPSFCFILHV